MSPETQNTLSQPIEATPQKRSRRRRFNLAHSVAGIALLLALESAAGGILDLFFGTPAVGVFAVIPAALAGGLFVILIATEVISEVRRPLHMLSLLSAVVFEFIVFFAFQYLYLSIFLPGSFPSLPLDPINLLLHSTMVFVFNPMNPAVTHAAQALLLINTMESLILVLFVLQNVWQFHKAPNEQ